MTQPTPGLEQELTKLTELEWRTLEEFRRDWPRFCDADPVAPDFDERMEAAGYIELQGLSSKEAKRVVNSDGFWAAKYGCDLPTSIWVLTPAGIEALSRANGEQP